jgi:iron(III) transport system permease protein
MNAKRGSRVLLGLAFASALVSLVPLWYLGVQSFSEGVDTFTSEILQWRTFTLIVRSVVLTTTVTAGSVIIGTFAAWVTTLSGVKGRIPLTIAFSLPLALPSYLSAFAWVSWIPGLSGFTGASLVLTLACYPYVMLPVAAAMSRLNPVHEDIARTMGRRQREILREVVLPQVRRPIASGALLVALYALSDFGAVAAMRHEVFTWVIYGAYRAGFNPTRAAALSVVLVAAAVFITIGETFLRGRDYSPGRGEPERTRTHRTSAKTYTTAIVGSVLVLVPAIVIPVVAIVSWIGRTTTRTVEWATVLDATAQSFLNGSITALVTLALAMPVAWCAVRNTTVIGRIPERLSYLTHALPGIVVAISIVYVGIRIARPWYQQTPLLVFGQVIIFLPVMIASIRAAIEKTPRGLEETAQTLGADSIRTFLRVTLPIALPGLLAGSALTMLAAVKELPVTLLLRPTGMDTLSTKIWDFSTISDYAAVGPFAVAMLLLAALPTALLGAMSALRADR